jgi:hypothetical protein
VKVGLVFLYLAILLLLSEQNQPQSELFFYKDMYTWEYLYFGLSILKLIGLAYMTFLWLYGTRWSRYDIFLFLRGSKQGVYLSRLVVFLHYTIVLVVYSILLYGLVFTLYPFKLSPSFVSSLFGNLLLFVWYYLSLFFLLERLIYGLTGILMPMLLYITQLLFFSVDEPNNKQQLLTEIIQLIMPDITVEGQNVKVLHSPLIILAVSFIWISLALNLIKRKDAIRTD